MAGKYGSGSFAVLLVAGYNLLAAKVKNFRYKVASLMEPTTGLGDTTRNAAPQGLVQVSLAQDGAFFDDSTNGSHDALKSQTATSRVLCFAVAGNTIGQPFTGVGGAYTQSYEVLGSIPGLTKANVGYEASGALDHGVIVQSHATKTIDWNTKTDGNAVDYTLDPSQRVIPITSATKANPCVVTTPVPHGLTTGDLILPSSNTLAGPSINSQLAVTVLSTTTFSVPVNTTASTGAGTGGSFVRANSSGGAVGYQQVSAFSGFSGFVGKIRDSADDTTYADLITFTDVTSAPGAERLTVSGTVDRYLCFDGNVTGTGSITVFSGLSRT